MRGHTVVASLSWNTPQPVNCGLDLSRHAADQFTVGIDENLLDFDPGDDDALGGQTGKQKLEIAYISFRDVGIFPGAVRH